MEFEKVIQAKIQIGRYFDTNSFKVPPQSVL